MLKQKKWFTLVELLVVILILSILSVLWFVSYKWYLKNARDWVRLMDLDNISKGLNVLYLNTRKYPLPEWNILTWAINNNEIFYQWVFWDELSKTLGISKTPLDPLLDLKYSYSVSKNKKNYQLSVVLEEELLWFDYVTKTYASDFSKAYLKWNYKWYIKYNWLDWKKYLTNIPSLLVTNDSTWDLLWSWTYFVVENNVNLPYWINWWKIDTNSLLKEKYQNNDIELVNLDISNCSVFSEENIKKFWQSNYKFFLENNKEFSDCEITPELPEIITENTNLYNLDNINNIFQNWNILTDNWNTNVCDINNLSINTDLFNWTKNISSPLVLTWNTIYKVSSWVYNLNWNSSSTYWYITFWWDCVWFIWAWTWSTKFISNFIWWWIKTTAWIFWVRWESATKTNIIISWFTIENSTWATNRYNFWIYLDDKISNIALKDIEVFNSKSHWVYLDDSANYNKLSNIKSFNNLWYWLSIAYNSKNNELRNITTYWNSLWWIVVDSNSSLNFLENIFSYNNTNHWLYLLTNSTWNTFSWVNLYSNTKHWLYVNTSSSNNIFKNLNSFSNILDWINIYNSNNNTFLNSNIYNNSRRWIYNDSSNWTYYNNINVFNNRWTISTIRWTVDIESSNNISINNSNIFNNNVYWINLYEADNNVFNNLNVFSNKKSTTSDGVWFAIDATATWNILNNIYVYNNPESIENYWTDNKYYWMLRSSLDWWLTLWNDWYLWFSNWNFNSTAISMDCSWHLNPNLWNNYWTTCLNKSFSSTLVTPITSLNFWFNIQKQVKPIKWNSITSVFEPYWNDWIDYNTSKFIWEF